MGRARRHDGVPAHLARALLADAADRSFGIGSALSLSLGPLLWGVAWIRGRTASAWIGWTAVLAGVSGWFWFVGVPDGAVGLVTLLVNLLASLTLFVAASVLLLRHGR